MSALRTSSFVLFLTSTNGNLTVGDDNLSKDAAYFTGDGLLSINKALCKGNKSLFISSALLLFIFFDNYNWNSEQSLGATFAVTPIHPTPPLL